MFLAVLLAAFSWMEYEASKEASFFAVEETFYVVLIIFVPLGLAIILLAVAVYAQTRVSGLRRRLL